LTAIYETAYPRIKSDITPSELDNIYTPSDAELRFASNHRRQPAAQYALLLLLKTFQRLGYFIQLKEIPRSVKKHIAKYPIIRTTRKNFMSMISREHVSVTLIFYETILK